MNRALLALTATCLLGAGTALARGDMRPAPVFEDADEALDALEGLHDDLTNDQLAAMSHLRHGSALEVEAQMLDILGPDQGPVLTLRWCNACAHLYTGSTWSRRWFT